ncbi:MAG: DUF6631 family protein [Gammaproteobacteria bacterium]
MDAGFPSTGAAFDALPPVPTSIEIGGEPIEISPLRIGELPAFARAIRPFAERLAGEVHWDVLIADHGEAVLQALAVAARRPCSWVEGLAIDDAMHLADALLEVNADFFVRAVTPACTRMAQNLASRMAGLGLSSGSSEPATATPTS